MVFNWKDKTVLVTGGTGSFGRAFARQMLETHQPRKLAIFSRDELKQHEMRQVWDDATPGARIRYLVGDVRDRERLWRALDGVDIVVHAAALKQVPACEYNPFEAVQTNIIGSRNVIEASIDRGVERVLLVSTDKAVNPVNLYGATKLCAEKLFIQGNAYSGSGRTRLAVTRYGNVVGSRGSVIPIFQKQAGAGRVTVTDRRMTRFLITLEQGVNFVVRAIGDMVGGEIFVPKIPSVKITELAKVLAPKAKVEVTGIRPGEKLHESMLSEDESRTAREYKDRFVILPQHPWWSSRGYEGGKRPADGFSYRSDRNDDWLKGESLRRFLQREGFMP
jgi:UDP-N-acetylglucosamine 4,6-dehydratase/5-epimerase